MKIQTNKRNEFGNTVLFGNNEVKFDGLGYAEVSEEVGSELLKTYKGWIFKDAVEVKQIPTKQQISDSKINTELFEKIKQLEAKVLDRESTIGTYKGEVENWKAETERYKTLYENLVENFENHKSVWTKEKEGFELRIELIDKSSKELDEIASQMGLSEDKYKNKSKQEKIELILTQN